MEAYQTDRARQGETLVLLFMHFKKVSNLPLVGTLGLITTLFEC